MKRVERLRIFLRAIEDIERRRAAALVVSERQLSACATKLAELEAYRKFYARQLDERPEVRLSGADLRDYQAFLAHLAAAVRQQMALVTRARTERDTERLNWQDAAQRAEVVGRLINRWKNEEYGLGNHCEQREPVERARRHSLRERAAH